jgi:hypothetical protein
MQTEQDAKFQQRLRQQAIEVDREDLLGVLALRFGQVPPETEETIRGLMDGPQIERLILVAANVPNLTRFTEELFEGKQAFRMVGDGFNPLSS